MSKLTPEGRQQTPIEDRETNLVFPECERGMNRKERREYMREIRAGVPHEKTHQGGRERLAAYYERRHGEPRYGRTQARGGDRG